MDPEKTELDTLSEIEFRLQQDLNMVQRRIAELLGDREIELEVQVHALRRLRFSVVPDLRPEAPA